MIAGKNLPYKKGFCSARARLYFLIIVLAERSAPGIIYPNSYGFYSVYSYYTTMLN